MASAARERPEPSAEDQLVELLKDRDWRLSHLYQVINEHGKEVTFEPNWAQVELFKSLGYRNLDLKVRQIGITTGYCMLWLDTALFCTNTGIGIVAHTKDNVKIILRDKIKFAYDRLPEVLKQKCPLVVQNSEELKFKNGSSIRVAVSFRSGTVQILHITEYGYICQHFPQRATEVATGAMQAVHETGIVVVESTAKGRGGRFYDLALEAQKPNSGWTFRFLPWYKEPEYIRNPEHPVEYAQEKDYLDRLTLELKITLSPQQRQFWCNKRRELGDDVFSEYPSTPEEAFRVSTQGAYYAKQMLEAYNSTPPRITKVHIERSLLVDTAWDLGMADSTAIWFVQRAGYEIRVVDYYENSGEGLAHYVNYMNEWRIKHQTMFGRHLAPHDIRVREWGGGKTRMQTAEDLGVVFEPGPMMPIADGIEQVRIALPRCVFDEERCARGIECLEHYRKQWNPLLGSYRNQPLHDWASHGADAFRTLVAHLSMPTNQVVSGIHARPVIKEPWT